MFFNVVDAMLWAHRVPTARYRYILGWFPQELVEGMKGGMDTSVAHPYWTVECSKQETLRTKVRSDVATTNEGGKNRRTDPKMIRP